MISFWPTKWIYSSYLTILKRVSLIIINLSQLFWNPEDSKEKLKKKYIDHKDNLTTKILKIDLEFRQNHLTSSSYDDFETRFLKELNRHPPLKTKILRNKNSRFITKEFRKAMMLQSKLKSIFNKDKAHFNWQKYKHQQNFCLNLLKKTKRTIFCQIKY